LIRLIPHSEINKQLWDAVIDAAPQQNIYAYSWYLDIACPGWQALILDDYDAIMPLPVNRKWGISYVYRPYFIQQLGVFSKPGYENTVMLFAKSLLNHFRFVAYAFNNYNQAYITTHDKMLWQSNNNYVLVNQPVYNTNLRRNLKQACNHNLEILNMDERLIVDLFRSNKGVQITNLKQQHYTTFIKICQAVKIHAYMHALGISFEQQPCAGMIIFEIKNTHVFIFSATNNLAKQCKAMPFLIDYYLNKHKPLVFDFEGSNQSKLAQFYKSFGSTLQTYSMLKINTLPAPVKWLKK